MTVVGLDDTDSRDRGMCTTYVAHRVAARLRDRGMVERLLLVRLDPTVPHKTRGNAALAIHTTVDADEAFGIAHEVVEAIAETADEATHPGLVVFDGAPAAPPDRIGAFARAAMRTRQSLGATLDLINGSDHLRSIGWKRGRGRIGALAAIGAWGAWSDWTYERIAYRQPERWGTPRTVDADSVVAAADWGYPTVWDTVDRFEGDLVCVPRTPGPVLYGIRGDDRETVEAVAADIEAEPIHAAETFVTNQGTDAHLREGGPPEDEGAFQVPGRVSSDPETARGGHVFFDLEPETARGTIRCAAFEPTKRFRDRVRALRAGDRITACGEVSDGTIKLEKFAVRKLVRTEPVVPACPACDRSMESAGADQGYRCRECGTSAGGKDRRPLDRTLERGWYEVPPRARRHVAKPLVRGGFDAPVHPER